MELTPKQQATELIKSSQKVLLLTHQHPDGDGLGSLLALGAGLKKMGKLVTLGSPDPLPKLFEFLPQKDQFTYPVKLSKDLVIVLDLSKAEVDKLGYKVYPAEKRLNIVVTPKTGQLEPRDVSFAESTPKYDLIIVLDSPDLERLGSIYEAAPSLFYETPLINIDHHASNEYFGKVNWVDLTATSTSEILVSLLEALSQAGSPLIDEEIATLLLTGVITDTNSFQNPNTTPKSLTMAAQLVAAGASQQEIIKHVYKTKKLSTLRLWGKILSRVIEDKEGKFIYSTVQLSDFEETASSPEEVTGILDELLKLAPGVDFVMLLYETEGLLNGSLRSVEKAVNVTEVAALFAGGGHDQAAAFRIKEATLASHQDEILEKIRKLRLEGTKAPEVSEPEPPEETPAESPAEEPAEEPVEEPAPTAPEAFATKPLPEETPPPLAEPDEIAPETPVPEAESNW